MNDDRSERGRSLLDFYGRIKDCTSCALARGRTNFVFGCGHPEADVMFVGEAPGEQEDRQGLPFVGPAGQLLNRLLDGIGVDRDSVFIANVIKCRPPGNRPPQPEEIEQCEPHLLEQIKIIRPKVLVALGRFAAQTLLRTTSSIGRLRGRWFRYHDIDLLPTYHPSAGLRAGEFKRVIEQDLQLLRKRLDALRPSSPS